MTRTLGNKPALAALFFYLASTALALRGILVRTGTLGHNWDWNIPFDTYYLKQMLTDLPYAWDQFSLGQPINLQASMKPVVAMYSWLGLLGLNGEYASKALVFATIVAAGMSSYSLVKDVLARSSPFCGSDKDARFVEFSALLAGLFYAFSPYLFVELIGGANGQLVTYAVAPLPFLFFNKALASRASRTYLFLTAASLVLIVASVNMFVLVSAALTLYALFAFSRSALILWAKTYALFALLATFAIVPMFTTAKELSNVAFASDVLNTNTIRQAVPWLSQGFIGVGYLARSLYESAITPSLSTAWLISCYAAVVLVIAASLLLNRTKEALFWLSVFLIFLIFVTGGKDPFGAQVLWLYEHFPLMNALRSPQHFFSLLTLSLSVLIGISTRMCMSRLCAIRFVPAPIGYAFAMLLILSWTQAFFTTGDIGMTALAQLKKDHLDVYNLSPGYKHAVSVIENDQEDFRVLVLPISGSPEYIATQYQLEGQGGDPLVLEAPRGTLVSDLGPSGPSKDLAFLLEKTFYAGGRPDNADWLLGLLNIKYIMLRKDSAPHFTPNRDVWNAKAIQNQLDNLSGITKVVDEDYVSLYKLDDRDFLPHIYASTTPMLASGSTGDLASLAGSTGIPERPAVFLKPTAPSKRARADSIEGFVEKVGQPVHGARDPAPPNLTFTKINLTRYRVAVQGAQAPYFLVFSETFHPGWKAYLEPAGRGQNTFEWSALLNWVTNGGGRAELSDHLKVNGYANAWYADKTGDYDIVLEYEPQRLFEIGIGVSLLIVVAMVALLVFARKGRGV